MRAPALFVAAICASITTAARAQPPTKDVAVDLSGHKPESGVVIRQDDSRLRLTWPMAEGEFGVLVLQLRAREPLIEEMGIAKTADGPSVPLLRKVNPATYLTVGVRDLKQGWDV